MFTATFIGATTGGSALLTIPTCIFLGFAPQIAVATTRVGVLGACFAGLYGFKKNGKLDPKVGIISAIFAICGAIVGAHIMAKISGPTLERLIGAMMIFILLVSLFKKSGYIKQYTCQASIRRQLIGYIAFFIIGILGGIFGGQGVMSIYILVLIFGQPFLEAAGTRLIVALVIAASSLLIYQKNNIIDWPFAFVFLIAMSLGGYLGTLYGIKKGEKWMKKLFMAVVIVMSLKLLIL